MKKIIIMILLLLNSVIWGKDLNGENYKNMIGFNDGVVYRRIFNNKFSAGISIFGSIPDLESIDYEYLVYGKLLFDYTITKEKNDLEFNLMSNIKGFYKKDGARYGGGIAVSFGFKPLLKISERFSISLSLPVITISRIAEAIPIYHDFWEDETYVRRWYFFRMVTYSGQLFSIENLDNLIGIYFYF